jgi:hypothetical protein
MNNEFIRIVQHPLKFKLFLLKKLPVAFFCGIRVLYIDNEQAKVKVPFKWLTQNPFRSIYFACLAMAAEMSTGVLAMGYLYKQTPTSMLITAMEAKYFKKSTETIVFTCDDGLRLQALLKEVMASGKPATFTALATGKDKSGDIVAEFRFTWSFKTKTTGSA